MHLNRDLQTSKSTMLILLLLIVALFSSVMNNTPIIIIFIPLVSIIAEKMNLSISKALIPLSYAGILGGMTTLVFYTEVNKTGTTSWFKYKYYRCRSSKGTRGRRNKLL